MSAYYEFNVKPVIDILTCLKDNFPPNNSLFSKFSFDSDFALDLKSRGLISNYYYY